MKIYLSIIIPAYNSGLTIGRLLNSIYTSKRSDIEVIVVSDGSKDNTYHEVSLFKKRKNLRLVQLKKQKGPAHARNTGAKKARGEVLLFLDSDVIVFPKTVEEVVKSFKEDRYRVAMTGVWDKKQESGELFPQYKALRDWSYWIHERKTNAYYYLFSTRIAAIRRDVFLSLGGFDESFRGADVEDIEFTYRIAEKYRVDFNDKMVVSHEFEDFFPIAKKYFKRSYQWVKLFVGRKRFDPVATTKGEALTSLSAIGITASFVIGLLSGNFLLCILLILIHLWGVWKFLKFTYRERGFGFTVYAFCIGILLYHFIFAGAVLAFTENIVHATYSSSNFN